MLDILTIAHFERHAGEAFFIDSGDLSVPLMLKTVKPLGTALREGGGFALTFNGPATPLLPQSIYPLRHAMLGTLDLFIVPVGKDKDGILYEVIFT